MVSGERSQWRVRIEFRSMAYPRDLPRKAGLERALARVCGSVPAPDTAGSEKGIAWALWEAPTYLDAVFLGSRVFEHFNRLGYRPTDPSVAFMHPLMGDNAMTQVLRGVRLVQRVNAAPNVAFPDGSLWLVKCPVCTRNNFTFAAETGKCSHCGFDAGAFWRAELGYVVRLGYRLREYWASRLSLGPLSGLSDAAEVSDDEAQGLFETAWMAHDRPAVDLAYTILRMHPDERALALGVLHGEIEG